MRLTITFAALLLFAAVTAVVACLPVLVGAVGAPADNYTIPGIPTDNTTPDEKKPAVSFHLEGPSSQGNNSLPVTIAMITPVPARDNNRLTAGDTWFLDIDVNAPGWLYIYEYYPEGSNPEGNWIAYKWHLKESGVWKLGPFSPSSNELEGQHVYRIWFYSGGQWTGEDPQSQKNNTIIWTYQMDTPALKIIAFEINPPDIKAEEGTLLFWDVQGASSVEISDIGIMPGSSGTRMIKPSDTTTYTLTIRDNSGKTCSQSATVTVRPLTFAERVMKFLSNPVILIMVTGLITITVLSFILLRRRYAAQSAAKQILSIPAPDLTGKPRETPPRAPAKAALELPGGLEIRITSDIQSVGRTELARCLEIDQLGLISRQHFRITCREDQFFIEDLGSTGGTRLNGADIRESGAVSLKDDDLIEPVSTVKLRFRIL